MSYDINKIVVSGRVGHEEKNEEKQTVKFTLANTYETKNKDGKYDKKTSWFNCIAFGAYAIKVIHKGYRLAVTGKIFIEEYKDNDGNNQKYTKIIADDLVVLDDKKSDSEAVDGTQAVKDKMKDKLESSAGAMKVVSQNYEDDDKIPF